MNYHCDGTLDVLCERIASWREGKGFETNWHNVPEKLMLCVTELSEAMEAYRHLTQESLGVIIDGRTTHVRDYKALLVLGDMDLPEREQYAKSQTEHLQNFKEELADTAIRLFDLCGSLGISLENEIEEKMYKNVNRPPKHSKER